MPVKERCGYANVSVGTKLQLSEIYCGMDTFRVVDAYCPSIDTSVEWRDDSTNYPIENPFFGTDMDITRTKYNYKGYEYSVICGHGTYGGDEGLLEVWIDRKGDPTGWHTADDIIAMMKGERK